MLIIAGYPLRGYDKSGGEVWVGEEFESRIVQKVQECK